MLQSMMETHTVAPRPTRGSSFVKKAAKSMQQKQLESFQSLRGNPSSSNAIVPANMNPTEMTALISSSMTNPSAGPSTAQEKSKVAKKMGQMEIQEHDEVSSEDQSRRGKEKVDDYTPPTAKKRKSSRSKSLKILD